MPRPFVFPLAVSLPAAPLVALSLGATLVALRPRAPEPSPPPPISVTMAVPPIAPSTDLRTTPNPCDDPLVGTWVARTHRPEYGDWHRYTLQITREHTVTIRLDAWVADAGGAIPQCPDGSRDIDAHQIAAAITADARSVHIDATAITANTSSACSPDRGYSLDHFTGRLDAATGTLALRNTDDGGNAHDRPYRFRRVSCP